MFVLNEDIRGSIIEAIIAEAEADAATAGKLRSLLNYLASKFGRSKAAGNLGNETGKASRLRAMRDYIVNAGKTGAGYAKAGAGKAWGGAKFVGGKAWNGAKYVYNDPALRYGALGTAISGGVGYGAYRGVKAYHKKRRRG